MQWIKVATLCVLLGGCGGANQTLLTSGGVRDFAAMGRLSEDYGDAEPDAVVTENVDGQDKPFKVWLHKSKPRIMVQSGSAGDVATRGFIRGLTGGLVTTAPLHKPFRDVALQQLAKTHGTGCSLVGSGKLTDDVFEWEYECQERPSPKPASVAPQSRRRPNP